MLYKKNVYLNLFIFSIVIVLLLQETAEREAEDLFAVVFWLVVGLEKKHFLIDHLGSRQWWWLHKNCYFVTLCVSPAVISTNLFVCLSNTGCISIANHHHHHHRTHDLRKRKSK